MDARWLVGIYHSVITCAVDRVLKITWDSTTEGF